jgi:UDP-glucose 4-epimerase
VTGRRACQSYACSLDSINSLPIIPVAVEAFTLGNPPGDPALGTGTGHSVREVIRAVGEVCGRPVPCREGPRRSGDLPVPVASADWARAALGWRPRRLELGGIIETAWRWHRDHPCGYGD